jgi:recombination protein RecA
MQPGKREKLRGTIAAIQKRFGTQAIGSQADQNKHEVPRLPTGFPALDAALSGGIPHGRITEFVGVSTSGMVTLALKLIASVQVMGKTAVYLDTLHTFDPDYAHRCGMDLGRLLLVHPYSPQQAVAMLPEFILNGGLDLLVLDMPLAQQNQPGQQERLSLAYGRLLAPLSKSGCALLVLTALPPSSDAALANYPAEAALPFYASLRLRLQKERWLFQRQDVKGYALKVQVIKNKLGPLHQSIPLAIDFQTVVQGDCA